MNYGIVNAIHQEITLSYTQAGRVVPSTIDVVAASLSDALDFSDVQEVHDTFKRARNMEDIPTQRVLKEALRNHRADNMPQPAIAYGTSEDTRPVTFEEKQYIFAWWHLHGTRMAWLTDDTAKEIVDKFESDPKHKEFTAYQNTKWTPVAYRNVKVFGVTTMNARLIP